MTDREKDYAARLLLWARTMPEHRLTWEKWQAVQAVRKVA